MRAAFVHLVFLGSRLALLALLVLLLHVRAAWAASPDGTARNLAKKAMEEDYLATDFDKAQDKLNKALTQCAERCTPQTRAILRRDLGVVAVGGLNDKDKGIGHFAEALKLDPTITLEADFKTKEIEAAFEAARKRASGSSGGGAGGPSGDFVHTPPVEQQVRTPVPIFVEYGGADNMVKVLVRYKAFGMGEWKPLELKKLGSGWGGNIPCADVVQGTLQYYVQGINDQNDPSATAGDRNHPFKVPIKGQLEGEPPHLPDQMPLAQCPDTGDCPPGFPCAKKDKGGDGEAVGGGEGATCEDGSECRSGTCTKNKCTAPEDGKDYSRLWVGVSGGVDFMLVSTGEDVCKLTEPSGVPVNAKFYCTNSDGTDFPSRADKGAQNRLVGAGQAGRIDTGGTAIGNYRILVSLDYALSQNVLLGGRLGLALNSYPGKAAGEDARVLLAPLHAEARLTVLFGKKALSNKFAVYALAALGASEWDVSIDVPVTVSGANPPNQTVKAWTMAGPGFGSLGVGVRWAPTPKRVAFMLAPLKANVAFGSGPVLPSLQPELGVQVGF